MFKLTAGDVSIEDRYYTKQEYAQLKPEQRKLLSQRRTACGQKPKVKGSKPASTSLGSFTKADLEKLIISAVKKQLSSTKRAKTEDDASTTSDVKGTTPIGSSNRSHAALTRKKWLDISMMITISDINISEQTTDLDSHADQSVVGNNSLIV